MSIIGFIFEGISALFSFVIGTGVLLITVRAIISWASPNPRNPIVQFLHAATDPFLNRIKSLMRTVYWGLDFSPAIGITILVFVDRTVSYIIWRIIEWLG